MKKIIIWGGNNKNLDLQTLDSHSSVNAFFLTKYLKDKFEIVNVTNIDQPEQLLLYENIDSILSTSQYGFTNRLIKKRKNDLFFKIKENISGKLCSIADNNNIGEYYEDILFCVRPIIKKNYEINKRNSHSTEYKEIQTGWCAEPTIFYPENVQKSDFNIFIDHAPYSDKAINYTQKFYSAIKQIIKKNKNVNINIYHQNNNGLVKLDFNNNEDLSCVYNRKIKVPYLEIAKIFRKIHIFCFTHKESAGLSGIEAAMAGAKLYIPIDWRGNTFIKKDLLKKNIDYAILPPIRLLIERQLQSDMLNINRNSNHNTLLSSNTWEKAANIIAQNL